METVQEAERVSTLNQAIAILAEETPTEGAPARYTIEVTLPDPASAPLAVHLKFQEGVVGPHGEHVNGISDESVIEVLIHRFKAFQAGSWASAGNAAALACLQDALAALLERTAVRRAEGVEGTTEKVPGERGYPS